MQSTVDKDIFTSNYMTFVRILSLLNDNTIPIEQDVAKIVKNV